MTSFGKSAQVILIGMACALGGAGCSDRASESHPSHVGLPRVGPDSVVVDGFGAATTDGAIALGNLSASIQGYEAFLKTHDDDIGVRSALVGLLLSRSQFSGTYADLDAALVHGKSAVTIAPDDAKAHQLYASALGAAHRFDEAKVELEKAAALGADVATALATNQLAVGADLAGAMNGIQNAVAKSRGFGQLSALAGVTAAQGDFEQADALFLEALAGYKDASPFPVAWIAFQRGVMWTELAGRPDLGRQLYAEAVRRLPGYVVANVHLAEIEAKDGDAALAVGRLEKVKAVTQDPEPSSRLAQFLTNTQPSASKAFAEDARKGYEGLLVKHPRAFADHAAEFFMGPGHDPKRALELALQNLEHRKNDHAYFVGIHAALAAENHPQACELATKAGPSRASVPLKALQTEVLASCP